MNATLATEPLVYNRSSAYNPDDLLTRISLWPAGLQEITLPNGIPGPVFSASYTWNHQQVDTYSVLNRSVMDRSATPRKVESLYNSHPADHEKIRVLDKAHEISLKIALGERFRSALKAARPALDQYVNTRAALERTWEALQYTHADVWNAAVLTLQQAQDAHQEAADRFDGLIHSALRDAEHVRDEGLRFEVLDNLIDEQGPEFAQEASAAERDYRPNPYSREDLSGVAAHKARKLIAHQRDQLTRATEMMPTATQKGH